ncbi:MAG: CBS domain-containing protein, partial [Thermoanaerobacteraceae bacterium]|nr:CBS domain-containing protein [Thermoanaerobacteraceae bacterium]
MTRMPNIITVKPEESVYEAAKKIVDHQIDALPVVKVVLEGNQEKFKIVGKVTKTTITKLFVELGEI